MHEFPIHFEPKIANYHHFYETKHNDSMSDSITDLEGLCDSISNLHLFAQFNFSSHGCV